MKRIPPILRLIAGRLRRDQTDAEQTLWRHLRSRQIKGVKFRRQHPIERYVVDFCCLEEKLIVELDGGQHLEQDEADQRRTDELKELGFRVLRFWNDDVLTKTDDVLEEILRFMENSENHYSPPSSVIVSEPSPGREMDPEDSHTRTVSNQEKVPHKARGSELGFRMPAEWERH
ncbi:MAG: DUF559 domain-containing protein, partial [Nitrospirota bacterium]